MSHFKCPFQKTTIIKTDDDGMKTITTTFGNCYAYNCPFWNSYRDKCMKGESNGSS